MRTRVRYAIGRLAIGKGAFEVNVRILAIDPGTATTGYAVVSHDGRSFTPIDFGVITTRPGQPSHMRLKVVYDAVDRLIELHSPDCVVIEELFFNSNVTTALAVGQSRGVCLLAAAVRNLPVGEYTPLQVKSAVVGYGRAEKSQVQHMVKLLLGLDAIPKPDDAADALALAICHAHSSAGKMIRR